METQILIIDDNIKIYESLKKNFDHFNYNALYAPDSNTAEKMIIQNNVEAVLLDIKLGNEYGISLLKKIKSIQPKLPVIMITGFASIDTAVESIKLGAYDYVKKPLNFDKLLKMIENAVEFFRLTRENEVLKKRIGEHTPHLYVENPNMLATIEQAFKLAQTDIPVLILGENGSGKEVVADYIHANSSRNAHPMLKINCAAFPESLLDNELFGHERGAFTDAKESFKGVFERAEGSTLLLDEIGDMPLTIQAKILRVLQNREIRRIGGYETKTINVRFIAATNKNIPDLIKEGKLRQDLYYRMNTATLSIPPLRDRKEDIPLLADYFLKKFSADEGKTVLKLSSTVESLFQRYDWPGNVRELKNTIHFGVSMSTGNMLQLEDLPPNFNLQQNKATSDLNIREHMEKDLIEKTLHSCRYNKKQAAEILEISRKTLYKKIEKYGINA
jgi:DNA-binding NtrC family response regulator